MRGVDVVAAGLRWDHQLVMRAGALTGGGDVEGVDVVIDGATPAAWERAKPERHVARVRPVVVVPGDPGGLHMGPSISGPAHDAGAVLLTLPADLRAPSWLLVPMAGSRDVLDLVSLPLDHRPAVGDITSAGRALAAAMSEAAENLDGAELAGFDPEGRSRIVDPPDPIGGLPPGSDPAAARLLHRALLVLAVIEAASSVDGPAHSATAARHRSDVLAILTVSARRAIEAAAAGLAARPVG